ncbi:MAG: HIT family protein [Candidatus Azobacteroides sp.]|nr:HIT family protein [Candidatus Azobacteroides sp.]
MATIFSQIVEGKIPSYKIAENEKFYAFLDIHPLKEGHTLIIPKKEIDYFFDISDEEIAEMIVFAKKIAVALKKVIPCQRVGMTVMGMEVPHAHIHLIPMQSEKDMLFSGEKLSLTPEQFSEIAQKITSAL